MAYELWDAELGLRLGEYAVRGEALAAVRELTAESHASVAPLGLTADGEELVASGEELVRLAHEFPLPLGEG